MDDSILLLIAALLGAIPLLAVAIAHLCQCHCFLRQWWPVARGELLWGIIVPLVTTICVFYLRGDQMEALKFGLLTVAIMLPLVAVTSAVIAGVKTIKIRRYGRRQNDITLSIAIRQCEFLLQDPYVLGIGSNLQPGTFYKQFCDHAANLPVHLANAYERLCYPPDRPQFMLPSKFPDDLPSMRRFIDDTREKVGVQLDHLCKIRDQGIRMDPMFAWRRQMEQEKEYRRKYRN